MNRNHLGKRNLPVPVYIMILMIVFFFIIVYSFTVDIHHPTDLTAINLKERLKPPSIFGISDSGYLFGTDYLGRDIFARLLYATRTSLLVSFSGLILAGILGTVLGVLAAYFGGVFDYAVIFVINVLYSIPGVLIGIVIATIFGAGWQMMLLLVVFTKWTGFARQIRGQVLQVKQEDFIEASKAMGAGSIRIFFEHILVNVSSQIIVTATLNLSGIILLESTLSFLGLGIQPPQTSLGVMVSSGRAQIITSWWLVTIPIIVIVIIVMSVSLIGDWLRDKLDPKLRNR